MLAMLQLDTPSNQPGMFYETYGSIHFKGGLLNQDVEFARNVGLLRGII